MLDVLLFLIANGASCVEAFILVFLHRCALVCTEETAATTWSMRIPPKIRFLIGRTCRIFLLVWRLLVGMHVANAHCTPSDLSRVFCCAVQAIFAGKTFTNKNTWSINTRTDLYPDNMMDAHKIHSTCVLPPVNASMASPPTCMSLS